MESSHYLSALHYTNPSLLASWLKINVKQVNGQARCQIYFYLSAAVKLDKMKLLVNAVTFWASVKI